MRRVNKLVSTKIMLKLYAIGVEASMVILYFFSGGIHGDVRLAGLCGGDPANMMDFLRAVISFSNGMPCVSWSPNLNINGEVHVYTVLGKTNLTDAAWVCSTNAAHRFFKVKVEMP